MIAHLTAFWHGDMDGPAFWLGIAGTVLVGAALGLALVRLLGWAVDNWPHDLGDDAPLAERRSRPRYETLITILGLIGAAVVFLTR